jgi:hypothetical protein
VLFTVLVFVLGLVSGSQLGMQSVCSTGQWTRRGRGYLGRRWGDAAAVIFAGIVFFSEEFAVAAAELSDAHSGDGFTFVHIRMLTQLP